MLDLKSSQYFSSLPKLIQESITQSGTTFGNEDELRAFVSNLDKPGNDNSFRG